jgi:hypothetical protein
VRTLAETGHRDPVDAFSEATPSRSSPWFHAAEFERLGLVTTSPNGPSRR